MARQGRKNTYGRKFSTGRTVYNTGRAIGSGLRMASRYMSRGMSGSKSNTRSASRSNASMVTFQKDATRQYTRKRMPMRKKRKWVSFVRKVHAVEASSRGIQQAIINDSVTANIAPGVNTRGNRSQGIVELNLYSVNAPVQGGRDKDYILNEVSNYRELKGVDGQEIPVPNSNEITRLRVPMNNAQIDITYTNTGEGTLEVDFYTITHRNIFKNSNVASIEGAQIQYNLDTPNRLGYESAGVYTLQGTDVFLDDRGVTPFQTFGLSKYAGGRIINKTKVLISPSQSVTRRYSDNKHRWIYPHAGDNTSRYDKDTTTYLAIAKTRSNDIPIQLNSLTASWTKVYAWTQEGQKNPRQSYFNGN